MSRYKIFKWCVVVNVFMFLISLAVGFIGLESGYETIGGVYYGWSAYWAVVRDSMIVFYGFAALCVTISGLIYWANKGE